MANTTWNPSDKTADCILSNLNLTARSNQFGNQATRTIDKQSSGKFYWECTFNDTTGNACGVTTGATTLSTIPNSGAVGTAQVNSSGGYSVNNVGVTALAAFGVGGIVCFAIDITNRLLWARNGAAGQWNASGTANPATGVGGNSIATIFSGGFSVYGFYVSTNATPNGSITANFGDTAFVGAVPAGFTSGFTAGASIPANALATQLAAEQWITTDPQARLTQIAVEQWASVQSTTSQVVMTQIAVEQWASVDMPVSAQNVRVFVLA